MAARTTADKKLRAPPPMPSPKVISVQQVQLNGIERQAAPKVLPSPGQEEELSSPSPHPGPTGERALAQPTQLLKVTANARIREGPSTSAKKIGTALQGTALEVKARVGDWVQFVDPASGSTGWIHSSLAKPDSRSGTASLAATAMAFAPRNHRLKSG
jgi:hypothetical protein